MKGDVVGEKQRKFDELLICSLVIQLKMLTKNKHHSAITIFIGFVWLVNGLFCKVLNLVPRHQEIVAGILGNGYSRIFTVWIGFAEMAMSIWIVSRMFSKISAVTQITVITVMNILEFILVPDLLLWGKGNSIFALLFILLIYYNEFYLHRKLAVPA